MLKKKNSLAILAAAASLPASSHAEVAPDEHKVSYRHSQYKEADSPRERTLTPTLERYEINIHQLQYARPLGENWYINSELQYETLSGASPMQTYKQEDGKSVLVTSGATIDEKRIDAKISPKRYFDEATLGTTLAFSDEKDYTSYSIGVDGTLEAFNKHTTFVSSFSTSYDTLSPSNSDLFPNRRAADGQKKRSTSLYQGINQIVDKNRTLQVGIGYTHLSGYLSDPYRNYDLRPGERDEFTLSTQYRRYMNTLDGAALHLDYRLYVDDWGISSHTITTRWAQGIDIASARLIITPSVRYYRQTQADFYNLQRTPATEFYSSDARLSSYGAINFGLNTELNWSNWVLSLDGQYYFANESLALLQTSKDEAPSLPSFTTISMSISYRY